MPDFSSNAPDTSESLQALAGIAFMILAVRVLTAVAVAAWMLKDADARGRNGMAAALIALCSAFYGIPATVMVACGWILFRPKKLGGMEQDLPDKLPSGISGTKSSEEFLGELEERH